MSKKTSPAELPFAAVLEALLDTEITLTTQHLYRLSDLEGQNARQFEAYWQQVPLWRQLALLEEMEHLAEANHLLSYELPCRLSLDNPDPQLRFLAVRGLLPYEPADLIEQFIAMLRDDPDENVRAVCAAVLGRFVYLGELDDISAERKEQVVDNLLETMRQEGAPQVRQRALESLGFSSSRAITQLIEEAFANTTEIEWITSALFAMGRSYDPHWIPHVSAMLSHQTPVIRFEAARAAGQLEIKAASDMLLELLDDPNDDIRLAAAWSLSQIGGEAIKETLEQLASTATSPEEQTLYQEALDNLLFNEEMELFGLMDFSDMAQALEE